MQKVYRLLRSNQESGPYSLEELLQQNLRPLDLVWVEGKSASWAYPYEIEALRPHVPAPVTPADASHTARTPTSMAAPAAPHIFVSLPTRSEPKAAANRSQPIEQRAEALRQRVQQQAGTASASNPDADLHTHYNRSLQDAEEAYTHWMYDKKTKKKPISGKYLFTLALTGIIFAGGLFAGQMLLKSAQTQAPPSVEATPIIQTAGKDEAQQGPVMDSLVNIPADTMLQAQLPPVSQEVKKENKIAKTPIASQKKTDTVAGTANQAPVAEVASMAVAPADTVQATANLPAEEKKKKGFLGGLFRKKKKDDAAAAPGSDIPTGENNSRKSRIRTQPPAPAADLSSYVELRTGATKDNWMIGVMGQKLTLLNRSPELIKSAAVEVSYLSEENNLLEKATVYFSNVAPRGKATAALPDHKLAEKVSLKVISANGE